MQTVILCGGKGLRLGESGLPKSLFLIGDRPILWHIMKIYAFYGFKDFVLCLGYKGDKIRDYFKKIKGWNIEFVETGLDSNTGERIGKIKGRIRGGQFFATYGDGLSDVNINRLLDFHKRHKRLASLTVVRPYSPFGIVGIESGTQTVTHFEEKPKLDHWINGGFFIFSTKIFNYIKAGDILEKDTFGRLVNNQGLKAYKHNGFWECMDTYKDNLKLNELWNRGKAPWARWRKK